jgi:hypothetical protein
MTTKSESTLCLTQFKKLFGTWIIIIIINIIDGHMVVLLLNKGYLAAKKFPSSLRHRPSNRMSSTK